jgi:APA family basic amino acid/polyamine antiporter
VALAAVICVLVMTVDVSGAIGFSSFGVLLYYLVANLAALTQDRDWRRFPKALQILGVIGCLILTATLPVSAVLTGTVVLIVGITLRLVRLRSHQHKQRQRGT